MNILHKENTSVFVPPDVLTSSGYQQATMCQISV